MEDIDSHENIFDILDLKIKKEINSESNVRILENSSNHNNEVHKDKYDSYFDIEIDDKILEFDSEAQALRENSKSLKSSVDSNDQVKTNLDYIANTEILPSHTDLMSKNDNISFHNKLLLASPNKSQNFKIASIKNISAHTKEKANCFTDNIENTFHQNKKIKLDYEIPVNLIKTYKEDANNKSISFEELIFPKNALPNDTKKSKYKIETDYKHLNIFKVDSNCLVDVSSTNQFSTMTPSIPFRDIANDDKNFNISDKNKKLNSDDTDANKLEEKIKETINNKKVIIFEHELSKKTYSCKEVVSSEESDLESEIKKCYELLGNNDVKANASKSKTSTKQTIFSLKNKGKNIRIDIESNIEHESSKNKFISPIAKNNDSEKTSCINKINEETNSHCKKSTSPTNQKIASEKSSPEKLFKFALKSLISGLESESNFTSVNNNDAYNFSPSEACDQKMLKDETSNSGDKNVKLYLEDEKKEVINPESREVKNVSTIEEPRQDYISKFNFKTLYSPPENNLNSTLVNSFTLSMNNDSKKVKDFFEDEKTDIVNPKWQALKNFSMNDMCNSEQVFDLALNSSSAVENVSLSVNSCEKDDLEVIKNQSSNEKNKNVKDNLKEEKNNKINPVEQNLKYLFTNEKSYSEQIFKPALKLLNSNSLENVSNSTSVHSYENNPSLKLESSTQNKSIDKKIPEDKQSTVDNKNGKDYLENEKGNVINIATENCTTCEKHTVLKSNCSTKSINNDQEITNVEASNDGHIKRKDNIKEEKTVIIDPAWKVKKFLSNSEVKSALKLLNFNSPENLPNSTSLPSYDKTFSLKCESSTSNKNDKNIPEDKLSNNYKNGKNYLKDEKGNELKKPNSVISASKKSGEKNMVSKSDSSNKSMNNDQEITNHYKNIKDLEEKDDIIDLEWHVKKHLSNNEVKPDLKLLNSSSIENLPNLTSLPGNEKTSSLKCESSTSSKSDDKNIRGNKPSNDSNKNGKVNLEDEKDNILIKPTTEVSTRVKSGEKTTVSKSECCTKNMNDNQKITNHYKNIKDLEEKDDIIDLEWHVKKHLSNNEVKPDLKLLNLSSIENLPNLTSLPGNEKLSSLKCESSTSSKNDDKNICGNKPSNDSNKSGKVNLEDEKCNILIKPTTEVSTHIKSGEKSTLSKSDSCTKNMNDNQEITNDDNKNITDYLEEEKDDIINPEWQAVKNLSTNEERYKQVRKCWKTQSVPDPNKNLTYHSYRKRHFDSSNLTTRTRQHKRQASNSLCGRAAKRFCTFFIDKEINSIEKIKNERKREIFNEMHEKIVSVDQQCFQIQRQTFYSYGWNENDEYYRHQNRVAVISEEYNKMADSWEETFRYQMQTLQERRNEVLKFYRFYKGLSDSSDDPTILTETQFQELNEIENMYRQFYNYYKD